MKNKALIIAIAVVIIALLGGGAFFMMNRNQEPVEEEIGTVEDTLPTPSPEEIGLSMEISADKRQVTIIVAKANDLEKAEWEMSWEADNQQAKSEDDVKRLTFGKNGEIDFQGKSRYESEPQILGTCSSGTCRYDKGVEEITLLMKVTKNDGKEYQVESKLSL